MPLVSWKSCLLGGVLLASHATAFTGSEYQLSHEYSGTNFFDGWDFYSGRDPTGGFVTYYSRSSAQLTGLISSSDSGPAYMGVNYVDKLPFNNQTGQGDGAGRPSIRIASKEAFTHGLFIGDFDHIPAGVCGTWPAFWTLGPNWPYTGEIDIMEGVNQNTKNVMSLHTNETCIIQGNSTSMTGDLENTNCAYYPDYNVGCGVSDPRPTSFGVGFNSAGGGAYAMQWTSEYIRIWQWSRKDVPADVNSKRPDPSSWDLPAGELAVGNCTVDQHFQSHKIIFDTTFCGEYAGNPYVWKTNDANSCAGSTGLATCDNFVANNPAAFKDAYWNVNYVRVYQLVDPAVGKTNPSYIASEQPANTATSVYTAPNAVATPNIDVDKLCPQYNFSIVTDGKYQYEIACDFDPPGPDIIGDPYKGFKANSLADCLKGCTYMNDNNGTNKCGGVAHFAEINFCYFKKYIDGNLKYRPGYNQIRLIYYGYPQITDDPRSVADSTLTSVFVETIPTPQSYRPSTTITTTTVLTTMAANVSTTSTTTTSKTSTIGAPPMGDNSTSTTKAVPPDYSETATSGYLNETRTAPLATSNVNASPASSAVNSSTVSSTASTITASSSSVYTSAVSSDGSTYTASSTVTSTDPSVTNSDFYIVFNVNAAPRRLSKRDVKYLAFDSNGQSILVDDQTQAIKFRLGADSMLMNGDQYVAIDSSIQPPRFSLVNDVPETPATVNVNEDGTVEVQGVNGYCFTSEGELAVGTDSGDLPDNCASVKPMLTATSDDSASTSSAMETTTTTISVISVGDSPETETFIETLYSSESSGSTIRRSSTSSSAASNGNGKSSSTARTSSSTTDVSESTAASTTRSSSAETSTTKQVTINDFTFAGCFGVPLNSPSTSDISSPLSDLTMTNNICTEHCGELKAYYAATSGVNCFCGTSEGLYAALVQYPDASCSDPCPGANRDFCGGQAGFQDALPATSSLALPRRIKLMERQSIIFLVSLYNNTLLLGGPSETDAPSTTDTVTETATNTATEIETMTGTVTLRSTSTTSTITSRSKSTALSFSPDEVSYNITGTNTATIISTTYVDVCHVCPGGLTTKATTITVPHCGCIASYNAAMGQSVTVPSPVVPMLTTIKNCACGQNGAQSTVTVTIPHTSSIAQLSSQLSPMPMGIAAGEPGNLGAMQSPAPADARGSHGSAPSTMNEPETIGQESEMPDHDSGMSASQSANTAGADADADADDAHVGHDMVAPDDTDEDYDVPDTDDVPLTAVPGSGTGTSGNTPMNMAGQNGNLANAAAPASSPSLSSASNTAVPVGVSNYTAPAVTQSGGLNGSFTGSGPIASFTSGASVLLQLSADRGISWSTDKFALSLLVGVFVSLLVGIW